MAVSCKYSQDNDTKKDDRTKIAHLTRPAQCGRANEATVVKKIPNTKIIRRKITGLSFDVVAPSRIELLSKV